MTPDQIVKSGEVELAVYVWGDADTQRKPKPTVVLVHGYPDAASVWKAVGEKLAERYYVVAYDVRGAGRSSRPVHTKAYDLEHLVSDLAAVADAVSPERPIHLVCHDWGSIQCWEAVTTERMAARIASYTSISGPSLDHAGYWIMQRLKSGSPADLAQVARQIAHSWYVGMFHLPGLAPAMWKLGLDKLWRRDVDAGHWIQMSHPDLVAACAGEFIDFVEGGAETAALKRARVRGDRRRGRRARA